jgi:choline monooxygenase
MQQCRTAHAGTYRDAQLYDLERRSIFARSWQFIGHESQLSNLGDVIAATIAGYPVLAVRSETGIKAFHNVCRHRAGPLFEGERGNCGGQLTCKYHGWSYALDGRLRNARDFGAVAGFDPREYGLHEIQLASWRGYLFVNMSKDAQSLSAHLAPLDMRLGQRDVATLVHAGRTTHDIGCNWKIYAENYLEGYHIPIVHPGLEREIDSAKYEVTIEGGICFHKAPLRDQAASAVVDGLWAFAMPNLGLNVYGHGLMWERIMPLSVNRTRLIYDYFLKPDIASDATGREHIMALSAITTAEDKWICERVQENIEAGIYETGVLSPRHESGVAWFQQRVSTVAT